MADALGTAVLTLTANDGPLRAGLNRAQQDAVKAGAGIENAIQGGLGALPGNLGGIGALVAGGAGVAAGLGAALVGIGAAAVVTANDMQKLINQLTLLTGSAGATSAVIANLKQFALDTPFDLPELANASKTLQAYGLNAADSVEWTKRLGDVATVTGTPLDRLALNFAQIISQGKASDIDLKQFALAGVPIWDTLSQVTGKTVAQLKDMREAIPATDVVAAFQLMTNEGGKFYEGGAKGSTDLDRQWTTLVDTLKTAALPLGQLITPAVVGAINNLIGVVQVLDAGLKALRDTAAAFAATGIGQLIGKAAGFLFSGPAQLGKLVTGPPQAPPPIPKTGPSLDDKQAIANEAAKKKLLEEQAATYNKIAEARIKAESTVASAQQNYTLLFQTGLLEGLALERAKQRLAIEEKQADVKRAAAAYDQALIGAGFNQADPKVIQAKATLDAAGINLQTAMLSGADAIAKASREAAKNLKDAYEGLLKARQSAFDFLNNDARNELRNKAGRDIRNNIGSGPNQFNAENIAKNLEGAFIDALGRLNLDDVKTQDLFDLAGKAEGIQEATNKVNEAVAAATTDLATQVKALLEKSWQVNLAVAPGGKVEAAGDVLGGLV
jgi:hypothetical protein